MYTTEELQRERCRLANEAITPYNIKQFLTPHLMLQNIMYGQTMRMLPQQAAHFIRGVIRHMGSLSSTEATNYERVNIFIDVVFQTVDDLIVSARNGQLDCKNWFRTYANSRGILRTVDGKLAASSNVGLFTDSIYSDLFTRYFLSYVA